MTKPLRIIFVLCIGSFVNPAQSLDMDEIIKGVCTVNMNLELEKSNKQLPEKMKEYTCNCFLEELKQGYSIESSRERCKDKATDEFIWVFL